VLEKLGLLREGVRRSHVRKGRKLCDVIMFGLLRAEWAERADEEPRFLIR